MERQMAFIVEQQTQYEVRWAKADERWARTEEGIRALLTIAEIHEREIEKLSEAGLATDRKLNELREAGLATDERLSALTMSLSGKSAKTATASRELHLGEISWR